MGFNNNEYPLPRGCMSEYGQLLFNFLRVTDIKFKETLLCFYSDDAKDRIENVLVSSKFIVFFKFFIFYSVLYSIYSV